jgi:hypothetical protein
VRIVKQVGGHGFQVARGPALDDAPGGKPSISARARRTSAGTSKSMTEDPTMLAAGRRNIPATGGLA